MGWGAPGPALTGVRGAGAPRGPLEGPGLALVGAPAGTHPGPGCRAGNHRVVFTVGARFNINSFNINSFNIVTLLKKVPWSTVEPDEKLPMVI